MKIPAEISMQTQAAELSVESLQQVYEAFTATLLIQQPLQDGKAPNSWRSSNCAAFDLFDRYVSSVGWGSESLDREAFLNYLETNQDFIPSVLKIWGFAWEVSTKLCVSS
jgi:hypothetical protein